MTQEQKKQDEAYWDTLKSNLPALSDLFANLELNQTPNPIEMLAAISEFVAFYTNCDSNQMDPLWLSQNMSQKKCRFCS